MYEIVKNMFNRNNEIHKYVTHAELWHTPISRTNMLYKAIN